MICIISPPFTRSFPPVYAFAFQCNSYFQFCGNPFSPCNCIHVHFLCQFMSSNHLFIPPPLLHPLHNTTRFGFVGSSEPSPPSVPPLPTSVSAFLTHTLKHSASHQILHAHPFARPLPLRRHQALIVIPFVPPAPFHFPPAFILLNRR